MIAEKDIKSYWEMKALDSKTTTTNDIYLRELELSTLVNTFKEINETIPIKEVLDLGCGDGKTIIKLAQEFPNMKFTGFDYSKNMIQKAKELAQSNNKSNTKFICDNILNLYKYNKTYDIIITDRCLINLKSFELQRKMIHLISTRVNREGYYIAIENFIETHNNLNKLRKIYNLDKIPIRWHNLYFKESEFFEMCKNIFKRIQFIDFASSYYFTTRVIYSYLCSLNLEEPNYEHEINKLSILLPQFGKFSPVRMVTLKK